MPVFAAEHVSPARSSPMWGEHRSRYRFATSFVRGKTVLDVACGTGFGGPILLGGGAELVLGLDFSAEALEEARKEVEPRYHLCRGDGTMLPLPEAAVDVITSFETIEHLSDQDGLVRELHRVLRPGGVLILSTPNARHTRPIHGKPRNPYHVREFLPEELELILDPHFEHVRLLGQRTSPEWGCCPVWERREHHPKDWPGRLRTNAWKLLARLPSSVRDMIWRRFSGKGFFPGEDDFWFDEANLDAGHVIVAVCRRG